MSPKNKNTKNTAPVMTSQNAGKLMAAQNTATLMTPRKTSKKSVICPLCMENLEIDDVQFFPCSCAYQVCRFCWHRIRTEENGLCPGCRRLYPENPANFTALTPKDVSKQQSKKRKNERKAKTTMSVNRLDLEGLRILQPNLIFVVGLPPRLIKADVLKKQEYFGKYGPVERVVINPHTRFLGIQGPTVAVYVTYVHNEDALKAIQCINLYEIDGRIIKANLGMTKYCKHFIKNNRCVKSECTYLHEIAAPELTFTIEEMNQRKHYEYEKRLHELLETTTKLNETKKANSKRLSVKTSDKASQTDIAAFCCGIATCELSKTTYQRNEIYGREKYGSESNATTVIEVDSMDRTNNQENNWHTMATKYQIDHDQTSKYRKDIEVSINGEKRGISKYYGKSYIPNYLKDYEKSNVENYQMGIHTQYK
ncbi:CCR4-NOT transcription complex subunit 4-like [Teleopsis dalmanni]|uniref:CCR4-NOT transcription complex subunit 4-like n=1 Tax=Teleopsis dalmanni TaxID=139649 RepID=UPI0018CD3A1D|nr:CCR4-NOT transcription complex subunit 4-like [Teleopsis dalmanni]